MTCFRIKTGETVRQWCIKNNICYAIVYKHLERGLTPDEACQIALKRKGSPAGAEPKHFYKGKPLIDMFSVNSKEYRRIIARLRSKYTIEDAVEMPLMKKRKDNK